MSYTDLDNKKMIYVFVFEYKIHEHVYKSVHTYTQMTYIVATPTFFGATHCWDRLALAYSNSPAISPSQSLFQLQTISDSAQTTRSKNGRNLRLGIFIWHVFLI